MTHSLLGLRVESYKRIDVVEIEFPADGGAFALMGINEAGKTSLLDGLESAIAGRKAVKVQNPVNSGAEIARIIATFDDIIVTRVYKPNGTTSIKVTNREGVPQKNAEELLKALYSHVALDPLAFSRLTDRDQVDTLLPMIGLDPKPLDEEYATAYALRTTAGQKKDAAKNVYEGFETPPRGLPEEEIDVAKVSAEVEAGLAHNAKRDDAERVRLAAFSELGRANQAVVAAENALHAAKAAAAAASEADERATAAAGDMAPEVDVAPLREKIQAAQEINAAVRKRDQRAAAKVTADAAAAEWAEIDKRVKAATNAKAKALAAAGERMPIPGLAVVEVGDSLALYLNGEAFADASTGVKIRTGSAIAMALNPNLRLIVIRDASLLDQGNREVIDELAKENGFLVLMEIADENSPVGVVLEDGTVREIRA